MGLLQHQVTHISECLSSYKCKENTMHVFLAITPNIYHGTKISKVKINQMGKWMHLYFELSYNNRTLTF